MFKVTVLSLISMMGFSHAENANETPLLVIPSANDLVDESELFGHGARLDNFLSTTTDAAPVESTSLSLSYDSQHLYVAGRVSAFALDPVSNMSDSFKAQALARDEAVTKDDSVEIRLQREDGTRFSIAVNALGTIEDTYYGAQPDKSWNGDFSVTAQKQEGYWQFLLTIPFSAIGLSDVSKGEGVMFNALRHDSRTHEWSMVDAQGLQLIFGDDSAYAQVDHFEQPITSTTTISAKVKSADGQTVTWVREILQNNIVMAEIDGSLVARNDPVTFDLSNTGKNAVAGNKERLSIFADGDVIYRSPAFARQNEVAGIRIQASAEVPFTLTCNGSVLSSGSRTVENVMASLASGANELLVQIPSEHGFNVKIYGPDGTLLESEGSWVKVESVGDEAVYKKTVAFQVTRLSPNNANDIYALAADSALFFHWDGGGLKNWTSPEAVHDFNLVIDVPVGIEFLGASGYLPEPTAATDAGITPLPELAQYTWEAVGEITRNGQSYERILISRNTPVVLSSQRESWLERTQRRPNGMVFGIRDARESSEDEVPPLYYSMMAQDIVEIPTPLNFKLLPELDGEAPEKIILSLYTRLGMIKDQELLEALFETISSAGINELFGDTASAYPLEIGLRQSGFCNFGQSNWLGFGGGSIMTDEVIEAYPEAQAINFYGKKMGTPCLAWLAEHEEAWPLIEEQVALMAKRNPSMTHFFWDYEFPPFPEGIHAYPMFSKFGIETFKHEFDIDEVLTPEIIREKYADEWVAYTCNKIAKVLERLQVETAKYGMQMGMYSGYHMPYTQRRYNVDWEKYGPFLDHAYCGYSKDLGLIDETRRALGGTPLVGGVLSQGPSAPKRSAAFMMRTLINHRGGLLFWYEGGGFDSETLAPIAEVSRLASAYEPFILDGERVAYPEVKDAYGDNVIFLHLEDDILIFLLNEGNQAKRFQFELPSDIAENYTAEGREHRSGEAITETVDPGSVYAILLRESGARK